MPSDRTISISIHAPREGSDRRRGSDTLYKKEFQSTLPVRGATGPISGALKIIKISIHAPREGSDADFEQTYSDNWWISIHAPREGSDDGVYNIYPIYD